MLGDLVRLGPDVSLNRHREIEMTLFPRPVPEETIPEGKAEGLQLGLP